MRLFAAIEPAGDLAGKLAAAGSSLRAEVPRIRPVRAGNIHLTLRFFGEAGEERAAAAAEACAAAAAASAPFEIELSGVGFFPDGPRARVLWAGVSAGRADMESLAAALSEETAARGFPPGGTFAAHATIARFGAPPGAPSAARIESLLGGRVWGRMLATEIVLMNSVLGPGGPVYERAGSFPLGGGHP